MKSLKLNQLKHHLKVSKLFIHNHYHLLDGRKHVFILFTAFKSCYTGILDICAKSLKISIILQLNVPIETSYRAKDLKNTSHIIYRKTIASRHCNKHKYHFMKEISSFKKCAICKTRFAQKSNLNTHIAFSNSHT